MKPNIDSIKQAWEKRNEMYIEESNKPEYNYDIEDTANNFKLYAESVKRKAQADLIFINEVIKIYGPNVDIWLEKNGNCTIEGITYYYHIY